MSLICPRESVSFDPRHVTCFPLIRKCGLVGSGPYSGPNGKNWTTGAHAIRQSDSRIKDSGLQRRWKK